MYKVKERLKIYRMIKNGDLLLTTTSVHDMVLDWESRCPALPADAQGTLRAARREMQNVVNL